MGYDYESNGSRTLKWMKEEFQDKAIKYLGGRKVKKAGRMDKVRKKEELGFDNQVNPLVRIFNRLNLNIEMSMKQHAFDKLL